MLDFFKSMDLMTGMAYWGMILMVIINAVIVKVMKIHVTEDAEDDRDLH